MSGITDLAKYAKGTALDTGLSGLAASGLGFASLSNPITAGLGILQGVSGLFGSSKSESLSNAAYSGGSFNPNNNYDFSYSKPFFDLENPIHIAVAGGLILLAAFAYKKVKK